MGATGRPGGARAKPKAKPAKAARARLPALTFGAPGPTVASLATTTFATAPARPDAGPPTGSAGGDLAVGREPATAAAAVAAEGDDPTSRPVGGSSDVAGGGDPTSRPVGSPSAADAAEPAPAVPFPVVTFDDPPAPLVSTIGAGEPFGGWYLERLAVELARWRMTLELNVVGAILRAPRFGLAAADACGLSADAFDRPDALGMYLAVRCCAAAGTIGDRTTVLLTARHVLRRHGHWEPTALPIERGLLWSDASLVNLACAGEWDGPGDVTIYATQLIDLAARVREATGCWERMVSLMDVVGREEPKDGGGTLKPETRNPKSESNSKRQ